jgi:chromate reductase
LPTPKFLSLESDRHVHPRTVAVIVGSLRKDSFNRKVAQTLMTMAPPYAEARVRRDRRPAHFYNQDLDVPGRTPPAWDAFRARIRRAHGVLFVTPEYNRSVPGVLKNAIDVGSRPPARAPGKAASRGR